MRLAVAVLAVAVLAACGRAGGGDPGASVTPTPTPTIAVPPVPVNGFDVLVSDQDRAVAVHVGQRLEVFLRQRTGMTMWSGIRVTDSSILAPIPTGIAAVRGVTVGGFKALAPGVTQITAYATADCAPDAACPMFAMLFSVTVTVT